MDAKLKIFTDSEVQKSILEVIDAEGVNDNACWFVYLHLAGRNGRVNVSYQMAKKNFASLFEFHDSN